jgi:hypothetical protein
VSSRQRFKYPLLILSELNPTHQYISHLTFRFFAFILHHRLLLRKVLSKCLSQPLWGTAELSHVAGDDLPGYMDWQTGQMWVLVLPVLIFSTGVPQVGQGCPSR